MAGLKIKSFNINANLALVDRTGNNTGVDIAQGLGHSKRSSGHDIKLSHFYAGYGSTTVVSQGYGDGYKIWSDEAERNTVPFLGGNNPQALASLRESESDRSLLAEIRFSDFFGVRQQDTVIAVKEADFETGSVTNTPFFGYAENLGFYGSGSQNDSVGSVSTGHYHYQFNETMCGISTNNAGWKIIGFLVQRTSYSGTQFSFKTRLMMAWDQGTQTPARANAGWTTCDVGKTTGSLDSDGVPGIADSMQITRTACTFVSNYDDDQSIWVDTRITTNAGDTTIYQYANSNNGEKHTIMLVQ